MIDTFSLLLCHGLMLLATWRLLRTPALDHEASAAPDGDTPARRGRRGRA
ncbi:MULTISPECIES: hypothetical protein [Sphingomonas]|jgi:hypothetical protein|nr:MULTISPECIES: hypothetical protein [Sphingomonas]MBY0300539.1 hypothetical protein [Sphingomonas ginsenosidimutans]